MWRGGKQDQMTILVLGESSQKLEALLLPLVRSDASMRFIDNDGSGARASEAIAALISFDVVKADNREGVRLKDGLRGPCVMCPG
jgi:hypothetical protein